MNTLLGLPKDLRCRILEMVVLGSQANPQVLRVCRQIHEEAEPLVYQRPQVFDSQTEMFSWLAQADWRHLHHVHTLKLRLQDLEISLVEEDVEPLPRLTMPDRYDEELEQLDKALLQLPNIKDLCLCKTALVRNPEMYNNLYRQALGNIARWWPQLKSVSFNGDEHPLSFVKSTQEIEKLRFTGFSTSTPMETEAVFSRLRHLREIEIILPLTAYVADTLKKTDRPPSSQSLTRQVVKNMRGLKTFIIRDTFSWPIQCPAFFTPEFLQALDAAHRASLRTLNVWLDFKPESGGEKALYSLLVSSAIKHLSLLWPGFDGEVLEHLPKSIVTLRLPLREEQPLEHLLKGIVKKKGDLPSLRKMTAVVICREDHNGSSRQVRSYP